MMPIYEYRCEECNTLFEELVPMGTSKPMPCPSCASVKTVKRMSAIGGIGKGSQETVSCGSSCPGAGGCGGGQACSHFS